LIGSGQGSSPIEILGAMAARRLAGVGLGPIREDDAMQKLVLPVVVEKDKDGYFVSWPSLQGCYTQGDSYEEAIDNIEDAIRLHIEDQLASGELLPTWESRNRISH
jgi:predicted RNase H-like HicB family nuclease